MNAASQPTSEMVYYLNLKKCGISLLYPQTSMTKAKRAKLKLPIHGQLGAGTSVEFLPFVKWKQVSVPKWAKNSDKFVLSEICGDSLIGAGINDGDLALIYLTANIRAGDLVAALTPEGMVVKYLAFLDGKIRLESANPHYPPHDYDPADLNIQGKVIRTERQ